MVINKNVFLLSGMLVMATLVAACDPMAGNETAGQYVDDTTITSKVIAAIVDDPDLKASEVNVETFKSVVQLSGWVNSSSHIQRAGNIARNVQGVHSIQNNLIVR